MLYQLYGLVIDIDDALSEVPSVADIQVDIQVRCDTLLKRFLKPSDWFMHWNFPKGEPWLSFAKLSNGYLLRFHQLADFFVNGEGSQITYIPEHGIPGETVHHLLLDQVIPLVINLKGGQALHVSAVLMPQGVVAFAGPTGSGKSTLSGGLFNIGYPLICDDCLALLVKDDEIFAMPAYPGLRLWEDALVYLFGDNGAYASVAHYTDKRRVEIEKISKAYCTELKPLKRIYTIADSPEGKDETDIVIEKLSARESFMALVRCVFRLDITDQRMLKRQFHFLERMASTVSVRLISFPRDFKFLSAVREYILNDLKDLDDQ
jgi:hypothetical protein